MDIDEEEEKEEQGLTAQERVSGGGGWPLQLRLSDQYAQVQKLRYAHESGHSRKGVRLGGEAGPKVDF